jgi:hypothetical protein
MADMQVRRLTLLFLFVIPQDLLSPSNRPKSKPVPIVPASSPRHQRPSRTSPSPGSRPEATDKYARSRCQTLLAAKQINHCRAASVAKFAFIWWQNQSDLALMRTFRFAPAKLADQNAAPIWRNKSYVARLPELLRMLCKLRQQKIEDMRLPSRLGANSRE